MKQKTNYHKYHEMSIEQLLRNLIEFHGNYDRVSKTLTLTCEKEFFWIRQIVYFLPALIFFLTLVEIGWDSVLLTILLAFFLVIPIAGIYIMFKKTDTIVFTDQEMRFTSRFWKINISDKKIKMDNQTRITFRWFLFGAGNIAIHMFLDNLKTEIPFYHQEQFPTINCMCILTALVVQVAKLHNIDINIYIEYKLTTLDSLDLELEKLYHRK